MDESASAPKEEPFADSEQEPERGFASDESSAKRVEPGTRTEESVVKQAAPGDKLLTTFSLYAANGEELPAGLTFSKTWKVIKIIPGGQAEQLGIKVGWAMKEYNSIKVGDNFNLKNTKQELIRKGARSYTVTWERQKDNSAIVDKTQAQPATKSSAGIESGSQSQLAAGASGLGPSTAAAMEEEEPYSSSYPMRGDMVIADDGRERKIGENKKAWILAKGGIAIVEQVEKDGGLKLRNAAGQVSKVALPRDEFILIEDDVVCRCSANLPLKGDRVVREDGQAISDHAGWNLAEGEIAVVHQVDKYKNFKLKNSKGEVSKALFPFKGFIHTRARAVSNSSAGSTSLAKSASHSSGALLKDTPELVGTSDAAAGQNHESASSKLAQELSKPGLPSQKAASDQSPSTSSRLAQQPSEPPSSSALPNADSKTAEELDKIRQPTEDLMDDQGYEDITAEVHSEASKHGAVARLVIPKPAKDAIVAELVKVFPGSDPDYVRSVVREVGNDQHAAFERLLQQPAPQGEPKRTKETGELDPEEAEPDSPRNPLRNSPDARNMEDGGVNWMLPTEEEMPSMPTRSCVGLILPGLLFKRSTEEELRPITWKAEPDEPAPSMQASVTAMLLSPRQSDEPVDLERAPVTSTRRPFQSGRQLVPSIGEAPRGASSSHEEGFLPRYEVIILILLVLFLLSMVLFLWPSSFVMGLLGGEPADGQRAAAAGLVDGQS